MKSKFLILAVGVVLIAAACNKSSTTSGTDTTSSTDTNTVSQTPPATTPSETPTPPPATSDSGTPTPTPAPSSVTINMTASGFSPANITVKSGTTVIFKNTDTKDWWPASNPHPVHTDYPGFDALKDVPPGGTYSFTFTRIGTWGYHDHLAPSIGGKITVTQ